MTNNIAKKPRSIFRPHPIFGWTLTPNKQVQVPFRDNVVHNMDENRHINQEDKSCVAQIESFQSIGVYGTVQALLRP